MMADFVILVSFCYDLPVFVRTSGIPGKKLYVSSELKQNVIEI